MRNLVRDDDECATAAEELENAIKEFNDNFAKYTSKVVFLNYKATKGPDSNHIDSNL
jgi:hypothetical protein